MKAGIMEDIEIIRIIRKAANKYQNCWKLYDSYEDMISELVLFVYRKLPLYNDKITSLSTYIYMLVYSKFCLEWRKAKTHKYMTKYNTVSLDEMLGEDESLSRYEMLGDDCECENTLVNAEIVNAIYPFLKEETKMYYLQDLKQKEIAKRTGQTQAYVSRKIKTNIKEIRNYFDKGEIYGYSERC